MHEPVLEISTAGGLRQTNRSSPRPQGRRYFFLQGLAENLAHVIDEDEADVFEKFLRDFVHVAIDDASRLAYAEVLPNEQGDTSAAFLARALGWFARLGIRVRRAMTDNGSGYVSEIFRAACARLKLQHLRTRPYRPCTNGKAERFIQTLIREWAYVRPYRTSGIRARALPLFLAYYNRERPHGSLSDQPPISRLKARL